MTRLMPGLLCVCYACCISLGVRAQSEDKEWTIEADAIDPARYFGDTVANGAIGIVSAADPFQVSQTLLSGAYDAYQPGTVSRIVATFDFLRLNFGIDGARIQKFEQVKNFRQRLDMREAALTTSFEYQDKASITYTMRALRQLPYVAMLDVTVVAKQPLEIESISDIFAPPVLINAQTAIHGHSNFIAATATAQSPSGRLFLAAADRFLFDDSPGNAPPVAPAFGFNGAALHFAKQLTIGQTFHFALVGATLSSVQNSDPLNDTQRMTALAALQGMRSLIEGHNRAWADLWRSDIVIRGDETMQQAVHGMLYHLYSFARMGSGYSIPPMGLSGVGYKGHIFWDAEMWMFPVLLMLQPDIAQSMLDYRYDRLPAARANAFVYGYRGAMFPLESAATGEEQTPEWDLTGPAEQHTTSDVGIAAWNYFCVTRDKAWLRAKGYPLLSQTADFWVSRVARHGRGRYDIEHVVGMDEFEFNVDNDAYTNAGAKENLEDAMLAARVLGLEPNPDWRIVHDNIPILRFSNGMIRENATFPEGQISSEIYSLSYPLHAARDRALIERVLNSTKTGSAPPGMTASYATLCARLGFSDRAYTLLQAGYASVLRPPFGVVAETEHGDAVYFATGAGGFLQTVLNGFGGMEVTPSGIAQMPTRLPRQWKSLTLTGIGVDRKTFTVH